jgi:hypothetical protein
MSTTEVAAPDIAWGVNEENVAPNSHINQETDQESEVSVWASIYPDDNR